MIRAMVVDDHQLFRNALRLLLETDPEVAVVGEAGDAEELLKIAAEAAPDVVCMDIGMPKLNGIEATRELLAICPEAKVIGVSGFVDRGVVLDMLQAGAVGYVAKVSAGDELHHAIRAAVEGKTYLCPHVMEVVAETMRDSGGAATSVSRLGARERQVLQLIAEGFKPAEIASRLDMASSTVGVHRRNIMHKLGLHSTAELTKYAIRNDLTKG